MTIKTHHCLILLASMAATVVGCSGDSSVVAPVSGRVTLDGRPVEGAKVIFQPKSGAPRVIDVGTGSYATTDADGRYRLEQIDPRRDGAVAGTHSVTITTARDADPDSDTGAMTTETLPARCTDGSLEFTVPPEGTEQADFQLRSKG
jgi:glycine/D-amino acid oxidase-like deaminating enzyme